MHSVDSSWFPASASAGVSAEPGVMRTRKPVGWGAARKVRQRKCTGEQSPTGRGEGKWQKVRVEWLVGSRLPRAQ